MRRLAHFSCGAASAVATKLSSPDVICYAETGGEDEDNQRFLRDCEEWFEQKVTRIRSEKFASTWDLWERTRYLSGIHGAPCTGELKIKPRQAFERPDDIHIFGYTADKADMTRAKRLNANWPDLHTEYPLIDRGLTKAACLALLYSADIKPPRVYDLGLPNANCIPCVKATSPRYWALIREHFPQQFECMAQLEEERGAKLVRVKGTRTTLRNLPADHATFEPIAPACDYLCGLAEQELEAEEEERKRYDDN